MITNASIPFHIVRIAGKGFVSLVFQVQTIEVIIPIIAIHAAVSITTSSLLSGHDSAAESQIRVGSIEHVYTIFFILLLFVFCVHTNRDGAVVEQFDFHIGTEFTGADRFAEGFGETGAKSLV